MGNIVVIGLAGRRPSDDWNYLLAGRVLVARRSAPASRALPDHIGRLDSFDSLLDGTSWDGLSALVADRLLDLARSDDVAYLTPGFAIIGDAIVDELRSRGPIAVDPGVLPETLHVHGPVAFADTLTVAAAECAEPFIGRIPAFDPTMTTILTNVDDSNMTRTAVRRVTRIYGAQLPSPFIESDTMIFAACDPLNAPGSIAALEHIVARLRRSDGCPWDREQSPHSLLPALAEEADELRQAIESGDSEHIAEEMGDVLVNLLLQAQIATEAGSFLFSDAVESARAKLVRRHPHVFGGLSASTSREVLEIWQQVKANEKASRAAEANVSEQGTRNV